MTPVRVAVAGAAGRMGRTIAAVAASSPDLEIVGGIDAKPLEGEAARALGYPRIVRSTEGAGVLGDADVVIDFSAPELLALVLDLLPDRPAPALVVGTTGLDAALQRRLDAEAARRPVVVEANFSVGVQLVLALAELAAATLSPESYDAEIVEAHHRRKVDAPSGTALALARAVARGRGVSLDEVRRDGRSGRTGERPAGEIGMHAVRGGGVVGEHRVLFLGEREQVELAHTATDRAVFAEGALHAARWVHGRAPGRYSLRDVLGIAAPGAPGR